MSSSRVQTPVNLKERIAALQQRNVSPTQQQSSQFASKLPIVPSSTGLRDRIARFEEKGGVPIPRGSFSAGVPSLPENAPAKNRGELYGNRIQGLGRPSGPPSSRPGSSFTPSETPSPRQRCTSISEMSSEYSSPSHGGTAPQTSPPPSPLPSPRRNSVAAHTGNGCRIVSSIDTFNSPEVSSDLVAPPLLLEESHELSGSESAPPATNTPTESSCDLFDGSNKPPAVSESLGESSGVESSFLHQNVDPVQAGSSHIQGDAVSSGQNPSSIAATPEGAIVLDTQESSFSTEPSADIESEDSSASDKSHSPDDHDPQTSAPPVLVDAAVDLLELVDEVQKFTSSDALPSEVASTKPTALSSGYSMAVLDSGLLDPSAISEASDSAVSPVSSTSDSFINGEITVETARHFSPTVTRAIPVIVSPSTSSAGDSFPLNDQNTVTAPQNVSQSLHASAQKSQTPLDEVPAVLPPVSRRSFTAVVHRKVTEIPAPTAKLVVPVTPQINRIKQPMRSASDVMMTPLSPGLNDLTALMQEAALLERRLTEGDVHNRGAGEYLTHQSQYSEISVGERQDSHSQVISTTSDRHGYGPIDTPTFDTFSLSDVQSVSIPSIREPALEMSDIPEEPLEFQSTPVTPPSGSPLPKYLSGIRRLTTSAKLPRSSSNMPGAYPRDSISLSSDDSAPLATPPENIVDGLGVSKSEGGASFGIHWPSVSPKKNGNNMNRSSSFADKLFSRNRTKSNVSTISNDDAKSIKSTYSSITSSARSHARVITDDMPRPNSWNPGSEAFNEANVPRQNNLFDEDIFSAFPSVPQELPPVPTGLHPHMTVYEHLSVGRSATLPTKSRKASHSQRHTAL